MKKTKRGQGQSIYKNKFKYLVLVKFAEWSLPTSENPGSNPDTCNFQKIQTLFNC